MQLVIAQDPSRFLKNDRTAALFTNSIKRLPPDDYEGFLDQANAIPGPFVLFWHERAEDALKLLAKLQREEIWPENLRGVVMYRNAQFAGLRSELAADRELKRAGLAGGRVHILAPQIGPTLTSDTVSLMIAFAEAAGKSLGGPPPFEWLVPPTSTRVQIAIQILAEIFRAKPEAEANAMEVSNWSLLLSDCAAEGLKLAATPTVGAMKNLVQQLRGSNKLGRLECAFCANRGYYHHNALGQNRRALTPDADLNHVTQIGREITELISEARALPPAARRKITAMLAAYNLRHLEDDAHSLVESHFRRQCGVLKTAATATVDADLAHADITARTRPDRAAELLRGLVECSADGTISLTDQ